MSRNETPTVKPKKGHWEDGVLCSTCSECKKVFSWLENHHIWDFCPNCGADMRCKDEQTD